MASLLLFILLPTLHRYQYQQSLNQNTGQLDLNWGDSILIRSKAKLLLKLSLTADYFQSKEFRSFEIEHSSNSLAFCFITDSLVSTSHHIQCHQPILIESFVQVKYNIMDHINNWAHSSTIRSKRTGYRTMATGLPWLPGSEQSNQVPLILKVNRSHWQHWEQEDNSADRLTWNWLVVLASKDEDLAEQSTIQ